MSPKTAIVTGGNRGIGFEICRQLAKIGFQVILSARDPEKGSYAADRLQKQGLNVAFEHLDLLQHDAIKEFGKQIALQYDKIDVLINNAGVLLNSDNTIHVQPSVMKLTFDTNFFGPLYLCQALIPLLKKSTSGRIINISSGMGAMSEMGGGYAAYRLSKTALNGLTLTMAKDLANTSVSVYAMCPGWVATEMGGRVAPRSPEQGADTAIWLATSKEAKSGYFYRGRKLVKW